MLHVSRNTESRTAKLTLRLRKVVEAREESTHEAVESGELRFGPFFLNIQRAQLRHNAVHVPLKPKEAELLSLLVRNRSQVVSRDALIEALWPCDASDAALSQTLYRLRRTLAQYDASGEYVRTVRGVGFQFVVPTVQPERETPCDFRSPGFRLYQRAMCRVRGRDESAILEGIELFDSALAVNPNCVPALIGQAQAYLNAGIRLLLDPVSAYYRAKSSTLRVIALEPANADAFSILSVLLLFFDGDQELAREAAEHARALEPRSPKARCAMVWQLLAREDYIAALSEANRALRTKPSSAHLTTMLGIVLYLTHRYDEASLQFIEALSYLPTYVPAMFHLACSLYMSDALDEAEARLDEMRGADLRSKHIALRGCIAIRRGDEKARKRCVAQLATLPFPADVSIATMHIAAGDFEMAATNIERALATREPSLFLSAIDPFYAPLRLSHRALIAQVRKGRRASCDCCATPLASATARRLLDLSLCRCAGDFGAAHPSKAKL